MAIDAARALIGSDSVNDKMIPGIGGGGFRLHALGAAGAYIRIGNGPTAALHHPAYDFNDRTVPYGSAIG